MTQPTTTSRGRAPGAAAGAGRGPLVGAIRCVGRRTAPLMSDWESQSGTTGSQVQRHQPFVHSCTGTGHSRRACSIG